MLKVLRTFALAAALMLPFAMQAQSLNEGFESTGFPPDDWTTIHVSGSQSWTRSTGTGNNSSSAFAYRKDVSGGYNDYLISPLLVPAAGETLSFYLASQYAYSYAGTTLTIEVSTTTPTVSAFTTTLATYESGSSGTFGTSGSSDWVNKTVDLSAYAGQQIYIAFHAVDAGYNADVRIDDVTGVTMFVPACAKPTGLTVTAATSESLTLSWTSDAGNFDIYNMTTHSQVGSSTTNSYTVENLDANTLYTFGVVTNCGGGEYSDTASVSGRTDCGTVAAPYTWNFDDMTTGATPMCFSHLGGGTSNVVASTSNSGANSIRFTGVAGGNTLVLPPTEAEANTLQLKIWCRPESTSSSCGTFSVGYLTDVTDATTFVALATYSYSDFVEGTTVSYGERSVMFDLAPVGARMAMRHDADASYYYWYLDDVTVAELPSCIPVSALSVDSVSTESITLTYANEDGDDIVVINMADSSIVATSDDMFATVNGLSPNTLYTFGVYRDCGNEYSDTVFVSGRTACMDFAVPYTWTFDNETVSAAPSCWTKVGSGTINVKNSTSLSYSDSMYLDFRGATSNLIVLPATEDEINTLYMKLWLRPESSSSSCGNFSVGYVTNPDSANTFHALGTYNYTDFLVDGSANYDKRSVLFSSAPDGARMALRAEPTSTNYYWYVDDVTIDVQPSCLWVDMLTVDTATSNSITLSWESEGENFIILDMADTSEVTNVVIADNTAVISGLTANTPYTFGVINNCGSETSDTVYISGRTACGMISSLPWTDDFESVPAGSYQMPLCWSRYTTANTNSNYPYAYNSSSYAQSGSRSLYWYYYFSTYSSTVYADTAIAILPQIDIDELTLSDLQLTFYGRMGNATTDIPVYVGTMSDPEDVSTFETLDSVIVSGTTHSRFDVNLTNAPATSAYVAIMVLKPTVSKSLYIDDVTLREQPSCAYVTGAVAIDSMATEESVTISWVDLNNSGATYTIYNMADSSVVVTGWNDTIYTIENLSPSTTYTFGIVANCSGTDAELITVSASTACGTITEFPFTESFEGGADCWTLVSMNAVNGPNGTGTNPMGVITYNSHKVLRFSSYTSSSTGTYDQYAYSPALSAEDDAIGYSVKVRYSTYGSSDNLYFGYITATDTVWDPVAHTTSGVSSWQNYEAYIPASATKLVVHYYGDFAYYAYIDSVVVELLDGDFCFPVANFAATEVGNYTTVLNWVEGGSAEAWQIMVNGDTNSYLEVEEVPYTMTVEPDSSYTVRVRAVCGDENMSEWSNAITFHTLVACPTPTNLHVVDSLLTATEATLAWTGFDDNYTVSYRVPQTYEANFFDDFESGLSGWTIRTLGETASSSSEGWYIFNPATADIDDAHSGNYVASAWSWNSSAIDADNWLITPQVTFGSTIKFWTRTNASYPDSYEVLLSTTGNANADFTDTLRAMAVATGTWTEVTLNTSSYTGQQGYIAIHHEDYDANYLFIDDFGVYGDAVPATDWITSTTTDNFVNLTGLTANTTYEFMLQGLCGTEDTTAWMSTTFTTLPTCTAVTNVAAVDVTSNSITLSWLDRNAAGATYIVTDAQGNEYTTTSIADTGCVITDLSADSLYNIVVKVVCAAGDTSSAAILNVRTLCDAIAIPYMEDFEATSAHLNCWSVYNIASSTGLATGGINGSYCFKFYYNTNPPQYLISPMLDIPEGDSVLLEFRYKAGGTYTESFQVGYSYTGNSLNDFTWLPEVTTNVNTYQLYSQMLSDSVKFISIKYTANDQLSLYIDSLYIGLPPTCFPVTNLTVSTATENSITLTWNGTSASYSIYQDSTFVTNTTDNTYTVTGLTAATAYTFGVLAVCAADDSALMVSVQANTNCVAFTMPFSENFNMLTAGIPNCWDNSEGTTTSESYKWNYYATGYDGVGLRFNSYINSDGNTNYLATPTITVNANAHLIFWYKNPTGGDFSVYASVDGGATKNLLASGLTGVSSWTADTIVLDPATYTNEDVIIYFVGTSNWGNGDAYIYLDDVTVEATGSDPLPTSYTVTANVNNANMGHITGAPTAPVTSGTVVNMTAVPETGFHFVNWTSGTAVISTTATLALTVTSDTTVTANFEANAVGTYTVTANVNNAQMGHITGAPTAPVTAGTVVNMTAVPETGYRFVNWTSGATVISTTAALALTVTSDTTVTANFELMPENPQYYTVTVNYDATKGTVTGIPTEPVLEGSSVRLTAEANEGYKFAGWVIANDTVGRELSYTISNIQSNVTITAVFVEKVGIKDVDMTDVKIFSANDVIYVNGAEGMSVSIFDVNGRILNQTEKAGENVEFRVAATGVYLVKVGNAAAKRVVVMR